MNQPTDPPPRRAHRSGDPFGEVLPEVTADERADPDERIGEDWYRENRPPHHDQY